MILSEYNHPQYIAERKEERLRTGPACLREKIANPFFLSPFLTSSLFSLSHNYCEGDKKQRLQCGFFSTVDLIDFQNSEENIEKR